MKLRISFVVFITICCISVHSKQFKNECGRKHGTEENEIDTNKWPWLIGFVYQPYDKFFCSGHLISDKHILSAAHCFKNKFESVMKLPHHVRAFISKRTSDDQSNERSVSNIILHNSWNTFDMKSFADIAIVVLTISFTSSDFQPICLPSFNDDEISEVGIDVSWRNIEKHSTPNNIFVTKSSICFATFPETKNIASASSFCGTVKADESDDSANGFYIQDSSEAWSIQGIRSVLLNRVDSKKVSLYTNIADFVYWIERTMKDTRETIWKYVEFNCIQDSGNDATFCNSAFQGPFIQNLKILPIFSQHISTRNADSVRNLIVDFHPSNYIYGELGEIFCNLKTLKIKWQSLKFVERSNFENMEYLQELSLFRNPIEFLPKDVFWDLPNLEKLNLCDCEIRKMPKNIFKNLKKLTSILISDNRLAHLPRNLFVNNLKLLEVFLENNSLMKIEVDFTKLRNLQRLNLEENRCINIDFNFINDQENLEDVQERVDQNCQFLT